MTSMKRRVKAALLSLPYGDKVYYAGPYAMRLRRGKALIERDTEQGNKGMCLEFTTKCNYRCAYCGRADAVKSGVREVGDGDVETLKTAMRNVKKIANISSIGIGGLGEPTLHPHFSELMEFTRSEFKDVFINLSSNFSTMTEDKALAAIGKVESVTWSFNIPDPEQYPKIEGAYTMLQAISNFKAFIALKHRLGASKPEMRVQLFQGYEKRYGWVLDQLKECGDDFVVNFKPINNFFGHLHPVKDRSKKIPETCYALLNTLNMTIDGDLYACCSGFYYGRNSETYLGNACTDATDAIKQRLSELIKKQQEQGIMSIEDCKNCDIFYTMSAKNLQRVVSENDRFRDQ